MIKKLISTNPGAIVSSHTAIFILRVGGAALILAHGIPKLIKVFEGDFSFADPIGLGTELSLILSAFAEGICGILLLLGLWTRLATIPLIINMAVAVLFAHAGDPFGVKEKALLFLLIFIVLFFTGGSKYSLDKKIAARR